MVIPCACGLFLYALRNTNTSTAKNSKVSIGRLGVIKGKKKE